MFVLDDEDHVEPGQDGGHEVDVLLPLRLVPSTVHAVCSRQHRAPRVQGCCDASLQSTQIAITHCAREVSNMVSVIKLHQILFFIGIVQWNIVDKLFKKTSYLHTKAITSSKLWIPNSANMDICRTKRSLTLTLLSAGQRIFNDKAFFFPIA